MDCLSLQIDGNARKIRVESHKCPQSTSDMHNYEDGVCRMIKSGVDREFPKPQRTRATRDKTDGGTVIGFN